MSSIFGRKHKSKKVATPSIPSPDSSLGHNHLDDFKEQSPSPPTRKASEENGTNGTNGSNNGTNGHADVKDR